LIYFKENERKLEEIIATQNKTAEILEKLSESIINLSNEIKKLSISKTPQINTEQIENPISEDLKVIFYYIICNT